MQHACENWQGSGCLSSAGVGEVGSVGLAGVVQPLPGPAVAGQSADAPVSAVQQCAAALLATKGACTHNTEGGNNSLSLWPPF